MGEFILLSLLGLVFIVFLACLGRPLAYRRKNDEWTKYDEDGRPVCGVGYRGFWTNNVTIGGPLPFKQREDGTWYDPKTGENCVTMTLSEMMERYKKDVR